MKGTIKLNNISEVESIIGKDIYAVDVNINCIDVSKLHVTRCEPVDKNIIRLWVTEDGYNNETFIDVYEVGGVLTEIHLDIFFYWRKVDALTDACMVQSKRIHSTLDLFTRLQKNLEKLINQLNNECKK